jgi:hypothetical protein
MLNANGGCVGALSANAKYIGILLTARNKYVTNGFKQCIKRNQLVNSDLTDYSNYIEILFAACYMLFYKFWMCWRFKR